MFKRSSAVFEIHKTYGRVAFFEKYAARYALWMNPPALSAVNSKLEWRTWAVARRKTIFSRSSESVSSAVLRHLHKFLLEQNVRRILSYRAFRFEVDLEPLPALLPQLEFYAPRANLLPQPHLTVHAWNAPTIRSKLGMLEPAPDAPAFEVGTLECTLLPGLAFDAAGFRLGYGMGFYDRLLERLPGRVLRVGVCSSQMRVQRLPREAHDRAVGWLADEHGVHPIH